MARNNSIQEAAKSAAALQDSAAAAIVTLVTGGSKMQAVFEGVKAAILTKAVGPLAQIAGVSMGVISAVRKMGKEWGVMGAQAAGAIESLEQQFRPLLKSIEAARNRMRELKQFAKETPFGMKEVAAANKVLENFSKGALSTRQGMMLVGDAAAVAGQDLESVAMWVGRLYDGLQSGRPVGEAAFRLQEMGIVTGQARNAIEKMQESGTSFSQMWRVVEIELGRARGGMEFTSKTLESLQQQLADTKEELSSSFGQSFLEGEKAGIEAQIKGMKLLESTAEGLGGKLSVLSNTFGKVSNSFLSSLQSIPGVGEGIKALTYAFIGFNAIVSAAATIGIGKMIAGMVGIGKSAKSTGTIVLGLKGAVDALRVSMSAAAAGDLAMAGVAGKSAVKMGVASAASGILSGALGLLKFAFRGVISAAGGIVALFALLGGSALAIYDHFSKSAEAVKDYRNETDALVSSLRAMQSGMKSIEDLMSANMKTTMSLTEAYADLAEKKSDAGSGSFLGLRYNNEAEVSAIEDRIRLLDQQKRVIDQTDMSKLAMSDAQMQQSIDRENERLSGKDDQRMAAIDMLPGGQQQAQRAQELTRIAKDQAEAQRTLEEAENVARAIQVEVQRRSSTRRARAAATGSRAQGSEDEDAYALAMASNNPLVKARYTSTAVASLDAARARQASAQTSLQEARKGDDQGKIKQAEVELEGATESLSRVTSIMVNLFGGVEEAIKAGQQAEITMKTMGEDLTRRANPQRGIKASQDIVANNREQAMTNAGELIALEERKTDLQDDQVAGQLRSIDLAQARINLEVQFSGLSQSAADARIAALNIERERVIELANRRKEMMRAEIEANAIGSAAGAMRAGGDVTGAREMERAEQRKRAEIIREQTYREAIAGNMGEGEASRLAEKARRASNRSFEARQDQEARQMGNATSQRQGGLDASALEQRAAQAMAAGMQDYAAALRESAERKREESSRTARIEEAMGQYGVSRERATAMIEEEIASARKSRAIEEKRRQLELKLMKEREASEAKARRLESSGNDAAAQRVREKQRQKDREQELVDSGYSRSDAQGMARRERRDSIRERSNDQYQAAAAAFAKFMEELGEMLERRKKFMDDLNDKELRAQGRGGEADRIKDQQAFETKAKELQKSLWLSDRDAVAAANRDSKANFDLEKRTKLEGLQAKLEEAKAQKSEAMRSMKMELGGSAVSSSMSKIGGASAISGSDVFHTDMSALRELQKETNEILQQIYEASSDEYEIHSMRKQSGARSTRTQATFRAERGFR